jgi:hypothetical protein
LTARRSDGSIDAVLKRRFVWVLAVTFVVAGVYFAGSHGFEHWAGQALQKAAPQARRVVPATAKHVLRESREHLPVYGPSSIWIARKSGSIVYFGIVGLFVLALRKRRATSLSETLLVTLVAGVGMSTIVEIFEWPEGFGDELFDLACGALGGLAAGSIAWWLRSRT